MKDQAISPWYKQPWLWFILAPLIATVLYSTLYITASVVTHDGVVLEEYSKKAKAFHEDKSRIEAARKLDLAGTVTFDTLTGDIKVQLTSNDTYTLPQKLSLTIGHPTKASLDINVQLRMLKDGHYIGDLQSVLKGRKTLIVEPADKSWQLISEAEPPYDQQSFPFAK